MTTSAELAALRASFEAFVKTYDVATSEAAVERKELMQAVASLARAQGRLSSDMAEVKPITTMIDSLRAKLTGALIVLGVIGAFTLWAVNYFKQQIINLLGA